MTEVRVGERPPHGGRTKLYATNAERAKANRQRKQAEQFMPDTSDITPESAVTALAVVLERLPVITWAFAERIEAACAMVADPEAVAALLAANVASCDEAVAVANAQAASADQRRVEAEAAVRVAQEAAEEATAHAAALADALREAEAETVGLREELEASQEARVNAASAYEADLAGRAEALERIQAAHGAELADLRAVHDETVAELIQGWANERDDIVAGHRRDVEVVRDTAAYEMGQLRDAMAAAAARAEAEMARLRDELAGVRAGVPGLVEAARDETRAAMEVRHAADLEACETRCAGKLAAIQGELDACRSRLEAATDRINDLLVARGSDKKSGRPRSRGGPDEDE